MTQPVNYQLLRLTIDNIPKFDGDTHVLEIFIDSCDFLINTYKNVNDANDPINNFLVKAILGKLSGRAQYLIGSRQELNTWTQIKDTLRSTFGDNRNLDCLVQDLIILRPLRNESPVNFGSRIQDARSLIFSKLKSISTYSDAERVLHVKNYSELSLKTYIRGLSGRLQDIIRLRNPKDLEEAISFIIEEENFAYANNQSRQMSQLHMVNKSIPKPSHNFYYQNPTPSRQNNSSFQHFPTGPVQMRPHPNPPQQKFPTNKQVFGSPQVKSNKNIFKPTGQIPLNKTTPMSGVSNFSNFSKGPIHTQQQQFQSTPMSGVSRFSNFTARTIQNSPQNQTYFRSSGPRNFKAEELNNFENNPTGDNDLFEDNAYSLNDNELDTEYTCDTQQYEENDTDELQFYDNENNVENENFILGAHTPHKT